MAINYQPSGFEGIAEILSQLGAVAGQARWGQELQQQQRRDESLQGMGLQELALALQNNPALTRHLGLEGLGELVTPTFNQVLDKERVGTGLARTMVAGDVAENEARVPLAQAAVAEAGATGAEAEIRKRAAEAMGRLNIPEKGALMQELEFKIREGQGGVALQMIDDLTEYLQNADPRARQEYAKWSNEATRPRLVALQEAKQHSDRMALAWANYGLDQKRLELASMPKQMSFEDSYQLHQLMRTDLHDQMERINGLIEAKAPPEQIDEAVAAFNNHAAMYRARFSQVPGFPAPTIPEAMRVKPWFGRTRIEYTLSAPSSLSEAQMAQFGVVAEGLASGEQTLQSLRGTEWWRQLPGDAREALERVPEETRRQATSQRESFVSPARQRADENRQRARHRREQASGPAITGGRN